MPKKTPKYKVVAFVFMIILIIFAELVSVGYKIVLANQLVAEAAAAPTPPPSRIKLMQKLNEARTQSGVAPLAEDTRLDNSAQTKADDMVANNYYEHMDKNGVQGYQLAQNAIPTCTYISENLVEASSASDALSQWMGSPDHKAAILDPKYSLTGFGIAAHGSYFYIVEHFCQLPIGTSVKSVAQSPSYAKYADINPYAYTIKPPTVSWPTFSTPASTAPAGPTAAEIAAQKAQAEADRQQRIKSCITIISAHGGGGSSAVEQCYRIQ